MRVFWRSMLAFLVVGAVGGGALAPASALGHQPRRMAAVALRPKWHLVSRRAYSDVTVSGRYVYIGDGIYETHATVIDEQTGRRLALTPPPGCVFDDENDDAYSPLGGSWVVATCNTLEHGYPYALLGPSYELYSIPNGTWMAFSPELTEMCALNAECATADPDCQSSYGAIGERWIELQVTCGYHSYPSTFAFQQIQSGKVTPEPAGVGSGGNQILDLNSSTLTQTPCDPLQVPSGGTIVPDGRFAIEKVYPGRTYIERCGAYLHRLIGGPSSTFTANSHAVLWSPVVSGEIDGLFLPSLRRLELRLPQQVASLCKHVSDLGPIPSSLICIRGLALTSRMLYVDTDANQVWSAQIPLQPAATKAARR